MAARIPESVQLEKLAPIAEGRYTFTRAAEFKGITTRYSCTCLKCDHQWDANLEKLLLGQACRPCSFSKTASAIRASEEDQLAKVADLSGGKISAVRAEKYTGNRTKYACTCLDCKSEWVIALKELVKGTGCAKCATRRSAAIRTMPEVDALSRLSENSGVRFIEWVGGYVGTSSRVKCGCECGTTWEASFLNLTYSGSACPSCSVGGYDKASPGTLYALMSECGSMVKIGITNNPSRRMKELEKSTPFSWTQIAQIDSQDGALIAQLEKELHAVSGQAITEASFNGYTEWRTYTPALMAEVARMASEAL
ncbi:MAG: GIY-YIG nuclease family protein [Aeromonas popoffii]|uniref:GIY-YIG nuclease family protein n=1 Tax=Aeromonas popoffii TaxID=70856 RepID=UPI003F38242A